MVGELLFWALFPALVAAGSAAVVWLLMSARMEVLRTRCQAALAEMERAAELQQASRKSAMEEAREAGRRDALQEFLAGVRVEERRYLRQAAGNVPERLVVQERIYLGNIPLTGWMEHEIATRELLEIPRAAAEVALVKQEPAGAQANGKAR